MRTRLMNTSHRGRVYQVLKFHSDLAFSILELVDRTFGKIWIYRYLKVLIALRDLEAKGLIESKHIGGKKYYRAKELPSKTE